VQKPGSSTPLAPSGKDENFAVSAPSINLPKGGGAIRGMGEKFAANPVTGTGSVSVPIATSPGRSGFGPQLSLSYDSGAGNGPFGFGWSLALPGITRKTDKGLPQYNDAEDSDVFILSGSEDLVPEFERDESGVLILRDGQYVIHEKPRTVEGIVYFVRRYRPRIEGLFARIERWTNSSKPEDVFWRSISRDSRTSWYGKTTNSRIVDPADRSRIFSWLICESYDPKGNVVFYGYKAEDSKRVFEDSLGNSMSKAHEANRSNDTRSVQRYLKRIRYGNRAPYFPVLRADATWPEPPGATALDASENWLFETVFDYGEHDESAPHPDDTPGASTHSKDWPARDDPFSSYRGTFEIRTYRLCQRVLMFHHFPGETNVGANCLVRSTDFDYSYERNPADARKPVYSFLLSVTQSGYKRDGAVYLKRSLPPLDFEYTLPVIQDKVEELDPSSLENLPTGLDGSIYQWSDLHGEGIPGLLTEQAGAWFYKRNLSPLPLTGSGSEDAKARFAPVELVAARPNAALAGGAQLMDLAGDGQPDLVLMDGPVQGLYEHDLEEGWEPFRNFTAQVTRSTRDPNLRFVDLNGDGHADILITDNDALVWHPSLAEEGFGPAQRVTQSWDEEKGPRLVFADGSQSIYLADLSGDGLTDLVRISNGEVCYWPNLGYGRFGSKVTMDSSPCFDRPEQFDHKRIRLADIDGSGTTDIIYLHPEGARIYFNQSGNSWSTPESLAIFPRIDDLAVIQPLDLLGNGTACLVWSSTLAGDARRQMRYINLMGNRKPHLLVKAANNLGAETRVDYAPSTKFYLRDKYAGKPWITKLAFPVHVVERVETRDQISRNRFVTRYAYHHGYFDGEEREFRGFGMVEQWDTEEFATLQGASTLPDATNIDAASYVPPVYTKSWFHTGMYLGRSHVSDFFAGLLDGLEAGEYFREAGFNRTQAEALLLADTELPDGLTVEEEREACRALKGSMLRQEIYALDATERESIPYTVKEQNFTIEAVQPRSGGRHAVFFTHPREAISYNYERSFILDPADPESNPQKKRKLLDPRVTQTLTLEVDHFGNVLKEASVGYRRRRDNANLPPADQFRQRQRLITYTENRVTNSIDQSDFHRTPLPAESRSYELTALSLPDQQLFSVDRMLAAALGAAPLDYQDLLTPGAPQKRLIEHVRTFYRPDDLGLSRNDSLALLDLGKIEPLALPGESYKLAFTPGLLSAVYELRVTETMLTDGGYVHTEGDANWWISSGRSFLSTSVTNDPAAELLDARLHFFSPRRYRDPFGQDAFIDLDTYDLSMAESRDALGNRVTVMAHDYRVLQPRLVRDPNGNQTEVAFDALGMVVGTAVMGKPGSIPLEGDSLNGFISDVTQLELDGFFDALDPRATSAGLLNDATTRILYDLERFARSRKAHPDDPTKWEPAGAATLARETHVNSPLPPHGLRIQVGFSYSDGFGREIQKKIQAEPGPLDLNSPLVTVDPRWVGSGWTIFNNKGKPVRQYEPFFSATHRFEFGVLVGVSPVLFYDPADRVIATLHPNHIFEKVIFDAWQQTTYDVNDTCAARNGETGDPRDDRDIAGYVAEYFKTQPADWQTWHALRMTGALGPEERDAATRAEAHADTPTTAHFDTLGRPFVTIARNRVICPDHALHNTEESFGTRVELDIEGNQREVRDERKLPVNYLPTGAVEQRIIMRYAYDMLGNRVYQLSMEAGARWTLNDVAGKPIRAWDSRGHYFTTKYDALRRPIEQTVQGSTAESDPRTLGRDILFDRIQYGEPPLNATAAEEAEAHRLNLRTRVYRHFDSAGIVTNARLDTAGNPVEAYDFKGNLLHSTRQFVSDYVAVPDWLLRPTLENEVFQSSTRYDALNRAIQTLAPRSSLGRGKFNIIQPVFNEANLLERIDVWLERAAAPAGLIVSLNEQPSPVGVTNIDYDAKGQRIRIEYKNGATTLYTYDPLTFRLSNLLTRRKAADFPGDDPQPPIAGWPGRELQNLYYTYDPAGNITHIHDDAQQTIFFKNKRVEPSNDYTYDALYRLIQATGREHLGQVGGAPIPHSPNDSPRVGILSSDGAGHFAPNDGNAMGNYIERYIYDAVGNFLQMQHRGSDPENSGWTRRYSYGEASLTEPSKQNNRLSSTQVGNGIASAPELYQHDVHGNIVRMPQFGGGVPGPNMHWDYKNRLRQVDRGGSSAPFYIYDSTGERVRKVWEKSPGLTEERFYLGVFESFRRHSGPIRPDSATLERETLHVMDDKQRLALVEIRVYGSELGVPEQFIRFQLGNHLGSAMLDLDKLAQINSYEEYTPYGSTTYNAVRSDTDTPKRYRYTGKERDEETGLYYHRARYNIPWLGRWSSADPEALIDGPNMYAYAKCRPSLMIDPRGTLALEGPEYIANKNTPEYKTFEAKVGAYKDPTAAPSTPIEKTEDRDVSTKAHDELVKDVVNEALKVGTEHFTDPVTKKITATKQEIIDYALVKLVIPLRQRSLEDSQSLIFRDADHYFTGLRQEWQRTELAYKPLKRWGTQREAERGEKRRQTASEPSTFLSLFSGVVAWVYDAKKIQDFKGAAGGGTTLDTSDLPASAAGGRDWAELGSQHFLRDRATLSKPEAPALVNRTPFEIHEAELKQIEREIRYGPKF
jgi:RHS repeat-associated protein